jgi:ABC-2 type transport system ATP-binding protein
VEVLSDPALFLSTLAEDHRAGPVTRKGTIHEFSFSGGAEEASELLTRLVQSGVRVASFSRRRENLEELFLKVGARELS